MFDFRMGVEPHDRYQVEATLNLLAARWVFQMERGETKSEAHPNGYLHFQGRVSLRKKMRIGPAKRLFLEHLPGTNYFEPTSNSAQRVGNYFYACKLQTRVEGPWSNRDSIPYVPKQYRCVPYKWQQRVLESAGFTPRTINVIIDESGGVGKSTLCGIARSRGYYSIPICCDAKEIIESVCDIFMAKGERNPMLILVDLPRAVNKKRLHSLFTALEIVKGGHVSDIRYHFREWDFDSPAMWVFTNQGVAQWDSYSSKDRWAFWKVVDGDLVACDHLGMSHNETPRVDIVDNRNKRKFDMKLPFSFDF